MNSKKIYNLKSGFTIIELMVSMGIFVVVMVMSVGAVLNTNVVHKKSQATRAAVDSMSFIMEEIARSARLGDLLHCRPYGGDPLDESLEIPLDCPLGGNLLAFEPYTNIAPDDPEDQRMYWMTTVNDGGVDKGVILKAPDLIVPAVKEDWYRLTPAEVTIDLVKSGFIVVGNQGLGQPRVLIRISGEVVESGSVVSQFDLQTTVSQRIIDAF